MKIFFTIFARCSHISLTWVHYQSCRRLYADGSQRSDPTRMRRPRQYFTSIPQTITITTFLSQRGARIAKRRAPTAITKFRQATACTCAARSRSLTWSFQLSSRSSARPPASSSMPWLLRLYFCHFSGPSCTAHEPVCFQMQCVSPYFVFSHCLQQTDHHLSEGAGCHSAHEIRTGVDRCRSDAPKLRVHEGCGLLRLRFADGSAPRQLALHTERQPNRELCQQGSQGKDNLCLYRTSRPEHTTPPQLCRCPATALVIGN